MSLYCSCPCECKNELGNDKQIVVTRNGSAHFLCGECSAEWNPQAPLVQEEPA